MLVKFKLSKFNIFDQISIQGDSTAVTALIFPAIMFTTPPRPHMEGFGFPVVIFSHVVCIPSKATVPYNQCVQNTTNFVCIPSGDANSNGTITASTHIAEFYHI